MAAEARVECVTEQAAFNDAQKKGDFGVRKEFKKQAGSDPKADIRLKDIDLSQASHGELFDLL